MNIIYPGSTILQNDFESSLGETNDLLLDINHDGVFDPVNDLTISSFFASLGDGVGLIETVGNLNRDQILNAFALEAVTPVSDTTGTI